MRNLKRVLTLGMAIAIMMSMLVVGAGAAFPDQNKIVNTDAVNMNVALGIIKGRDTGNFDPTGNVTRAEMAKMICVMLNGGNEPTVGVKATPTFKDIKGHWAEGYIEYCSALGIVAGMGDGTFAPNANVTGTQAAKMLLVALGYDAVFEGFNGTSWAVKINVAASQKNLFDDLAIDPNAALNRDDAAQMVWNTLSAKEVKYTYSLTTVNGQLQNIQAREDKVDTLIANKFKSKEFAGQLTKFTYNSTKKEWTYSITIGTGKDQTVEKFTTGADFTKLYGHNVNVVAKMDGAKISKVFGFYGDDCVVLFSGIVDDMDIKSDSVKIAGKTYDLDSKSNKSTLAYEFTYDKDFDSAPTTTLANLDGAQLAYNFDAIDSDNDGKVDFIVVYPYTVEEVTYVGSKTITAGSSYTVEDCNVYAGIAKDEYTKITLAKNSATNKTTLAKVDKMVNGKISTIKGVYYTIDGTAYALAKDIAGMDVGATVKDAAVVNGFIWAADTSGATSIEDYAIVIGTEKGAYGSTAKLIFSDGTKKIVDTNKDYTVTSGGANKIADGTAVTFEINSDKDYELKKVNFADKTGTGFDQAIAAGAKIGTSSNSSSKVKYIGGCNIADDAVIFVHNTKDNSYEVITGAKLMTTNVNGLTVNGAYADKNSSNGFYVVKIAYISSDNKLVAANYNYGYALTKHAQVKNKDGKVVYEYTLWDGSKEVKVQTTDTQKVTVNKGDVVRYSINTDGNADKVDVYGTSSTTAAKEVVAITAFDGTYIQLNGSATRYEIDKTDTKILYIDNDAKTGIAGGAIQKAIKDSDGQFIPNALVIASGSDVDLIVFDVNNKMYEVTAVEAAEAAQKAYVAAGGDNTAKVYTDVTAALSERPLVNATIIAATKALNVETAKLVAANNVSIAAAEAAQTAYLVAGGKTTDPVYVAVTTAVNANPVVKTTIEAKTALLVQATNDLTTASGALATAVNAAKAAQTAHLNAGGRVIDAEYAAVSAALAANPQVTATIVDKTTDLTAATKVLTDAATALTDAKTAATAAQTAYVAAGGKTTDPFYVAVTTAVTTNVTATIVTTTNDLKTATADLVALNNAIAAANTALNNSRDEKLLYIAGGGASGDTEFQDVLNAEAALKGAMNADPKVTVTIEDLTAILVAATNALN